MREFKEVTTIVKIPSSIKCDKCGKEMITQASDNGNGVLIYYDGGYDSDFFGDGTTIEFDLCEECLFNFIQTFKDKTNGLDEGMVRDHDDSPYPGEGWRLIDTEHDTPQKGDEYWSRTDKVWKSRAEWWGLSYSQGKFYRRRVEPEVDFVEIPLNNYGKGFCFKHPFANLWKHLSDAPDCDDFEGYVYEIEDRTEVYGQAIMWEHLGKFYLFRVSPEAVTVRPVAIRFRKGKD